MTRPRHIPAGPLTTPLPEHDAPPSRFYRQYRHPSYQRGFTLLELLVVILLISVVLAAALPRFMSTGEALLRTDASRVSSFLRYISDASATRKVYYKVSFDIAGGLITAESSRDGAAYAPEGDPAARLLKLNNAVAIEEMTVEGLGRVNAGTVELVFAPAGGAPAFTLRMAASGKKLAIAFNPYSGEVTIKDGNDAP